MLREQCANCKFCRKEKLSESMLNDPDVLYTKCDKFIDMTQSEFDLYEIGKCPKREDLQ